MSASNAWEELEKLDRNYLSKQTNAFLFPFESGQHAGKSFFWKIRGPDKKNAIAIGQVKMNIDLINFFIVEVILFLANNKLFTYAKENPTCLFSHSNHYPIYPARQEYIQHGIFKWYHPAFSCPGRHSEGFETFLLRLPQ